MIVKTATTPQCGCSSQNSFVCIRKRRAFLGQNCMNMLIVTIGCSTATCEKIIITSMQIKAVCKDGTHTGPMDFTPLHFEASLILCSGGPNTSLLWIDKSLPGLMPYPRSPGREGGSTFLNILPVAMKWDEGGWHIFFPSRKLCCL